MRYRSDADKARIEGAFEFVRDDCTLRILPPRARLAEYLELIRELPEEDERIGEILVKCGTLTAHELKSALKAQAQLAQEPSPPTLGEILIARRAVQPAVVEAAASKQQQARVVKGGETNSIRVDADKLERLINLVGELIIAGASTNLIARAAGLSDLNEATSRMSRLVEDIRDQALQLRMVQIGGTFTRFQRVVRDVARELNKDIRLELNGAETELDKTVIEQINDPLMHLVRNAMDHGIEDAGTRAERGKSPQGVVKLNAFHDSGSVVIEVSDDGGGLDRERILAKALERGLIAEGADLTDREVFGLIFEPGFSTAAKITNLSGRGVGMDVVKRNVTELRGEVEVDSAKGVGTTVRIRLPLTLAIIDGFLVRVGRSSYVLPLEMVDECIEAPSESNRDSTEHQFVDLRGAALPYVRLRDVFRVAGAPTRRESIVVVRVGKLRAGFVVDELLGEHQTVIKPLAQMLSHAPGLSGSTILADGSIALIIDTPALLKKCVEVFETRAAA
jgi:two-component system chemotaxis sensor kinase CheA